MIACLGYGILLVIVFAFMCCLMPWWMVLLIFVSIIAFNLFWGNDALFKIQSRPSRPKKKKGQQKKAEVKNAKDKTRTNTTVNRTNANIGAGTYYQKNDDFDSDRYIAAKREEQAAYDDFIASLDMDD